MILALKLMNKLMTFSNEDMMVVTARACAGAGPVTAQTILDKLTNKSDALDMGAGLSNAGVIT